MNPDSYETGEAVIRSNLSQAAQNHSASGKTNHTRDEWEAIREDVVQIYVIEQRKLFDTMREIETMHNFHAW